MKRALLVLSFVPFLLAACGDTWTGIKEDTRDNTAATGRAVEKAGEKIQNTAE